MAIAIISLLAIWLSCSTAFAQIIRGVNLGGWLVAEQWITPSVFSDDGVDEWTLCSNLGKSACESRLQKHWDSFITLSDFQAMKQAGLNSIRIPIGYWAVNVLDYEPYVQGQYPYLIQAVQWAQQVGFTVLIDLHGAPGSQNGNDHSGLTGVEQFAYNQTNVERTVGVLKNLSEEFRQEQYGGVVTGIELLNEPRLNSNFTMDFLKAFYEEGAAVVQGQNVTVHDAFWGPAYWADTNYTIDTHQYYAFTPFANLSRPEILTHVCNISSLLKQGNLQPTMVGEFSLETGYPPNSSMRTQETSQEKRTWYRLFFEAQQAAYEPDASGQASIGWYYWTWKTEWDIDTWSFRRGVEDGYIPSNVSDPSTWVFPRLASGCVDSSFNYTAPADNGGGSWGPGYWGAASNLRVPAALVLILVAGVLQLIL